MRSSYLASLRNAFFSGLLLIAPLAATWIVFSWLVGKIGGGFRPYLFFFVPEGRLDVLWDILAAFIVIALVTALGYTSRYVFGKYFGGVAERFVQGIPGIGAVYHSVKQIVDTFNAKDRHGFSKVVLVEFPRKGAYTIGFLTSVERGEVHAKTSDALVSVFVPTTPNPTGGYLIFVPRQELIELDMSTGDGMKLIISGGTVVPPWPAAATATRIERLKTED
ncbi:MAG TPA: DUF502 domain-containing protein [Opitutaceae bacterium]|jgi:uncharacterized membrane protein|nr:DUF502 domain-containing protein [Opitutaceae bacterium]